MVFAVLCLCLYARVRIYVCAWRVGLCLLSAVVPVCRGTGFVRGGDFAGLGFACLSSQWGQLYCKYNGGKTPLSYRVLIYKYM